MWEEVARRLKQERKELIWRKLVNSEALTTPAAQTSWGRLPSQCASEVKVCVDANPEHTQNTEPFLQPAQVTLMDSGV